MKNYTKAVTETTQREPILGKPMVQNNEGGFVFAVDDWTRLERWLILGSEDGSFYVGEKQLTRENASAVIRCIATDGARTVKQIVAISDAGRAPKNDPAIFALALCLVLGDEVTKREARLAIPKVCRIGTHLFSLAEAVTGLGIGWGRGTRKAFGRWYTEKKPSDLQYGLLKYQSRNGWSNADLLKLSHAKPTNKLTEDMFRWAVGHFYDDRTTIDHPKHGNVPGYKALDGLKDMFLAAPKPPEGLELIWAFEQAKVATSEKKIAELINTYGLPREAIPTQFLNSKEVWEALLYNQGKGMPLTALVRNLAKMTSIGLIAPLSDASRQVSELLHNTDSLRKARLHPLTLLIALRQYKAGHGDKGSLTWTPDQHVLGALEVALHGSFAQVEPTGKRFLFGLDVSGSMSTPLGNLPISSAEAGAVLALVSANVEPRTYVHGFAGDFVPLNIHKGMTVEVAAKAAQMRNFGTTDCAQPMLHAIKNKIPVDVFIVCTDNETYAGHIHPSQALKEYRKKMGIPAKLVVIATSANGFSIADPADRGMLDVSGMDTSVPSVISDFARN